MSSVQIQISAEVEKLSGGAKSVKACNNIVQEKILPIITQITVDDIQNKAKDYAKGVDLPPDIGNVQGQAKHKIGQSPSEYSSTGVLADSIVKQGDTPKINKKGMIKIIIEAVVEYASWVEFGTGVFGPTGRKIKSKRGGALSFIFAGKPMIRKEILGQPPQPFMRGAVWFVKDNYQLTSKKIQMELRKLYG